MSAQRVTLVTVARLDEPQRHAVALADRGIAGAVLVVQLIGRGQGPHPVGIIGIVERIGVDLAHRGQPEARRLGEPANGRDLDGMRGLLAKAGMEVVDVEGTPSPIPAAFTSATMFG